MKVSKLFKDFGLALLIVIGGFMLVNNCLTCKPGETKIFEVSNLIAYSVTNNLEPKEKAVDDFYYNFTYAVAGEEKEVQGFSNNQRNSKVIEGKSDKFEVTATLGGKVKVLYLSEETLAQLGIQ